MKKKMPKNQSVKIVGYSVPTYSSNEKTSIINYYVVDLKDSNNVVRKQIKLNHIKCPVQRAQYAKTLISELKKKLKSGWHPDGLLNTRKYETITDALKAYEKLKDKEKTDGHLRPDSYRSIKSYIKIFTEWLQKKKFSNYAVENITKSICLDFMNHVYMYRNASPKTFNNYLLQLKTIFNWLVENDYIIKNPFKDIKLKVLKKKSEKVPLTKDERQKVKSFLEKENKHFLLACYMVFHCGLRRTEITKIKISDIDLKNQVIRVAPEVAKMNRERYASMPLEVIYLMIDLKIFDFPSRNFMIGYDWKPSDKAITPKKLSDTWSKLRETLELHPQAQFYSLRKSGGIQKAEDKMSIQAIKDFFGHTGLDAAVNYFENHRFKGNEELKKSKSEF